jgi:hypothetical protein
VKVADESFGVASEYVIVVDCQPCSVRPHSKILGKKIDSDVGCLGSSSRPQPLVESIANLWSNAFANIEETKAYDAQVCRLSCSIERVRAALKPLTGQNRLPVPGRSDEHDHASRRFVEQARQARPLDDVAVRD